MSQNKNKDSDLSSLVCNACIISQEKHLSQTLSREPCGYKGPKQAPASQAGVGQPHKAKANAPQVICQRHEIRGAVTTDNLRTGTKTN